MCSAENGILPRLESQYILFLLWRHEHPTWRCCELHSGEILETIPQSAYPKCPPLPTGDRCSKQQHELLHPRAASYTVRDTCTQYPPIYNPLRLHLIAPDHAPDHIHTRSIRKNHVACACGCARAYTCRLQGALLACVGTVYETRCYRSGALPDFRSTKTHPDKADDAAWVPF